MKSYKALYKKIAFMYLNYSAMEKRFSAHQKVPESYTLKPKAVFFPFSALSSLPHNVFYCS